jgi:N-acetylglucosamine kinase
MGLDALLKAKADPKTKIKSIGMSLSGCERDETNRELVDNMKRLFPDFCGGYAAVSDTRGTLATASDSGGIVLIAGTGSNALLINPDGSMARCGGHGHLLGDEASATWIAFRACKTYFDHVDKKVPCDLPLDEVKEAIFKYFDISERFDLFVHCYEKFDKTYFAGLCKRLADRAIKGDELCARDGLTDSHFTFNSAASQ